MTYMFILKCTLKLVEEIILYYDARSKKHQITYFTLLCSATRGHCTGSTIRGTESSNQVVV